MAYIADVGEFATTSTSSTMVLAMMGASFSLPTFNTSTDSLVVKKEDNASNLS